MMPLLHIVRYNPNRIQIYGAIFVSHIEITTPRKFFHCDGLPFNNLLIYIVHEPQ
jgi:hypothetical protein